MQTVAWYQNKIRETAQKGLDITRRTDISSSKMRDMFEEVDKELTSLESDLVDAQFIEQRRAGLGVGSWGDANVGGDAHLGRGITKSLGARPVGGAPLYLTDDNAFRLFKSASSSESITVKAAPMTTGTTDPATTPISVLPPIGLRREPTRILDVLPVAATEAAVNRYYVTTASGAGAGVTAEGAQKPESDLAFTKVDVTAEKIAVWAEATEEALEDFAGFQAFLTADLQAQIIDAENYALLNGTGTTPQTFKGLLQVTGTQSTTGTLAAALDGISQAIDGLRVGARYVDPDTIIMNPADLGKIRRLKASGTGDYLLGSPSQSGPSDIWGIPVVKTTKIAAGTIVVANLAQSCQVFLRAGLTVRSNANGAGFRNNLIEFVAEERLALAVTAPSAINIVTLT